VRRRVAAGGACAFRFHRLPRDAGWTGRWQSGVSRLPRATGGDSDVSDEDLTAPLPTKRKSAAAAAPSPRPSTRLAGTGDAELAAEDGADAAAIARMGAEAEEWNAASAADGGVTTQAAGPAGAVRSRVRGGARGAASSEPAASTPSGDGGAGDAAPITAGTVAAGYRRYLDDLRLRAKPFAVKGNKRPLGGVGGGGGGGVGAGFAMYDAEVPGLSSGGGGDAGGDVAAGVGLDDRKVDLPPLGLNVDYCIFCYHGTSFLRHDNAALLSKLVSDRGQILPRRFTHCCPKHQRK